MLTIRIDKTHPVVDLNGPGDGTGNTNIWTSNGPVHITTADATITDADSANLSELDVQINSGDFEAGDLLAANTEGTSISASYSSRQPGGRADAARQRHGGPLPTGAADVTFDTSQTASGSRAISVWVYDDGRLQDAAGVAVYMGPPPSGVDLNGPAAGTATSTWTSGFAVYIASGATITDYDNANLDKLTATITSGLAAGDDLVADTTGTNISASFSGGVLTLSGPDTVAHYQQVLRSIVFDATTIDSQDRMINVVAFDDGTLLPNTAVADVWVGVMNIIEVGVTPGTSPPTVVVNGGALVNYNSPPIDFSTTWSNGPVHVTSGLTRRCWLASPSGLVDGHDRQPVSWRLADRRHQRHQHHGQLRGRRADAKRQRHAGRLPAGAAHHHLHEHDARRSGSGFQTVRFSANDGTYASHFVLTSTVDIAPALQPIADVTKAPTWTSTATGSSRRSTPADRPRSAFAALMWCKSRPFPKKRRKPRRRRGST